MNPMRPPTKQQQIESQLRFVFLVLQHRIEERNWAEAIQQSAILSKILMEMQRVAVDLMQLQLEEQNVQPEPAEKTG